MHDGYVFTVVAEHYLPRDRQGYQNKLSGEGNESRVLGVYTTPYRAAKVACHYFTTHRNGTPNEVRCDGPIDSMAVTISALDDDWEKPHHILLPTTGDINVTVFEQRIQKELESYVTMEEQARKLAKPTK